MPKPKIVEDAEQVLSQQDLIRTAAFLSAGFGEVFYSSPEDEPQLMHNRAVLNDLKARCVAEAQLLLETNRDLLNELATAISEKKTLSRDELAPYLARVVKQKGNPWDLRQ
jgi:hypothetical protein